MLRRSGLLGLCVAVCVRVVVTSGQKSQLFPDAYAMPFVPLCNPPPPRRKRSGSLLEHEIRYKYRACRSSRLALSSHSSETIGGGFRVWIAPLGVGICRAVWHRLEFHGEQRAEGRLPLHKISQTNSEVPFLHVPSLFFTGWVVEHQPVAVGDLEAQHQIQQRWHDGQSFSKGLGGQGPEV